MIRIKKKIEIQNDNKLRILFSEKLFKGQQGSTFMKEEWVWQGQERCIHCKTGPWEKEISSVKQQLKTLHQILPSRSFPQMPFCSPAVSLSPNLFHYAHKLLPFGTVFGAAEDVTSERWKALQLAGIHWWGSWQPWPADRTCTWDVATRPWSQQCGTSWWLAAGETRATHCTLFPPCCLME